MTCDGDSHTCLGTGMGSGAGGTLQAVPASWTWVLGFPGPPCVLGPAAQEACGAVQAQEGGSPEDTGSSVPAWRELLLSGLRRAPLLRGVLGFPKGSEVLPPGSLPGLAYQESPPAFSGALHRSLLTLQQGTAMQTSPQRKWPGAFSRPSVYLSIRDVRAQESCLTSRGDVENTSLTTRKAERR